MSFIFPKMPAMPAPPQLEMPKTEDVPSYEDQEREKAELEKLRATELARTGRRSTIKTTGTGLLSEPELYQKSLLGEE
jgi:hypothetical protein